MWTVETTDEFDAWFTSLADAERIEIDSVVGVLKVLGPHLKRPHADTLNGSAYANMKELRGKTAAAAIRIAFAFDPFQHAILLTGGIKSGVSQTRFYRQLIARADKLYAAHLVTVERKRQAQMGGENRAMKSKKKRSK
jgi:hypothetical protein